VGAKGEALAKQLEAKAKDAVATLGKLTDAAEQLVQRGLIMHIDEHFGSIRKTVGR
jgi:hypothetical protein